MIFKTGLPDFATGAATDTAAPGTATGGGAAASGTATAGARGPPETAPQAVQKVIPSPSGEPHFVQN